MLKVIDENTEEVQNMLVEEISKNVKIPKMMNDNDFFNACDESNRIDGNKINYKLGEWKDNIDDLVKMKTYTDWLLKGRDIDVVDLVKYKMEELASNELKNYPLEYVEFVAREILNIPLELEEIEMRYRAFRKGQRREEKENYRADIDEKKLLKAKNKYLIKKEGDYIIELN